MKITTASLLIVLLATPIADAQTTDPVTQEDLAAMEQRLNAAIQDGHSGTAAVVRNEVAAVSLDVAALNNSLATIQSVLQHLSQEQASLLESVLAMEARVAALEASNQELTSRLGALENDTFHDHRNLWKTFTDDQGSSHLEGVALLVENNTAAVAESREYMDALSQSQFRLRGDLDNMTSLVTTGFNHVNKGQEAVFEAADRNAGAGTMTNVLVVLLVALNVVLFSYAFKIPRSLWRRLEFERKRVEARGEYVEPPCPLEDQGQALGDYFDCPEQETCPVGQDCHAKALQLTEQRILEQPQAVMALGTGEGDATPREPPPSVVAPVPVDLSRFGRKE